jgi:serine/threonine protein kinase
MVLIMEKTPNYSIDPFLKTLTMGTIIDERFEIVSKPVRRSHTYAIKVRNIQTGLSRVLLLIPPQLRRDTEALQLIREQYQIVRMLDHPNIARYYDMQDEGRLAYIETEFVAGYSLKTLKSKLPDKRFSEEDVRLIADQVLQALEYAHNQNILHRDLKPSNIVLTTEKKVKLIDFGLGETMRQALQLVQDATASTIILYWSPEQVSGKPLSIQSDVYSLGAVMYELLSGQPPFFTGDVYHCILHKNPEPIPDISPFMNQVILKALAKKPDERFQNCAEMRKALQQTGGPALHSRPSQFSAPQQEKTKKEKPVKVRRFGLLSSFLKPSARYTLISALFVVLIAIFVSKLHYSGSTGQIKVPKRQTEQSAAPLDSFQIKMRDALLQQAQAQVEQGHLVLPRQNNALSLLEKAQKIDPSNKGLQTLKRSLKARIAEKIKTLQNQGKRQEARAVLNAALRYFPNDSTLTALNRAGQSQPIRIEILNGAGKKGIAKQLRRFLEKEGFQVVGTENYRINGRIYWNVRRSVIKGSFQNPDAVKALRNATGLPYQAPKTYRTQNRQATVSIILGKDYRKYRPFK